MALAYMTVASNHHHYAHAHICLHNWTD